MKKITIILTLTLISLLLITSCNTADEGVFQRIRESVPKVDVGSVDIIGKNGTTIYAYTSKSSLQAYNTTNDTWESLGINNVFPGLYTADNSLNIGNIYFAERADANTANNLYTYTIIGGTTTGPHTGYEILQMNPQYDLMLVETNTGYSVLSVSDTGTTVNEAFDSIFSTSLKPRIISQSSTQFIVSGRNAADTTYVHYYLDSATALTEDGSSTVGDYPIVAMMDDGPNLVVVNSNGDVWTSTGTEFTFVNTIPDFPDRDPEDMPYPFFIYNNRIILQNENNVFYEITNNSIEELENTASSLELIEKMNNIQAKSYLVDGRDLYVGTMQNGIFKIDMPIS